MTTEATKAREMAKRSETAMPEVARAVSRWRKELGGDWDAMEALWERGPIPEIPQMFLKDPASLGWVYELWSSREDRRIMRSESQSPRNAEELSVRNRFFTPRYVAEFLAENTVGRLWWEARGGKTRIADVDFFVRQKEEEPPRLRPPSGGTRSPLDPRYLRIFDPACGTGHLLLAAYDVLEVVYEEAREMVGGDFSSYDDYEAAVPSLILGNLFGYDVDPVAARLARLALERRAGCTRPGAEGAAGIVGHEDEIGALGDPDADLFADMPDEVSSLLSADYDVVLMNPPFGSPASGAKAHLRRNYPRSAGDLYAAFVERGIEWIRRRDGYVGALTPRNGFFLSSFRRWREEILLGEGRLLAVADLGSGVLRGATVEAAAYVIASAQGPFRGGRRGGAGEQ